jgi:hypothetical protein
MPKPKPTAEYMALSHAAEILGRSKNFVKRAVAKGLIRATSEPFKSNLNKNASAFMVLVNAQDVRDAIAGKIDLSSLDAVRVVERKELPKDLAGLVEMVVHLTQTTEQLSVMVMSLLERGDTPPAKKPARKEIPDV